MGLFIEKTLLCFLIVFFTMLVCVSMYSSAFKLREGMTDADITTSTKKDDDNKDNDFKKYDTNDPNNALILAQQNAGNIMSLEQKIETQQAFVQRLDNLESTVENQQTQLDGLVEQQAQYAQDISANEPVEITGANEEETD